MRQVAIVSIIVFSPLVFLVGRQCDTAAPRVSYLWQFDVANGQELARPPDLEHQPFNGVLTRVDGKQVITGPDIAPITLEEDERVFVPFHAMGYFSYAKIGRTIAFVSRRDEELWRKPYFSYPVSDPNGQLIFLLTGDNNRVGVVDPSGNFTGAKSISGNFMTHFAFAARSSRSVLIFSSGDVHVLGERGESVASTVLDFDPEDHPVFAKSVAISPDGELVAVHCLAGGKDHVFVLEVDSENGDLESYDDFVLEEVYPHLTQMALNDSGVIVAAPNRTYFLDLNGSDDYSIERIANGVYRPAFADREYFVYGAGSRLRLLDRDGRLQYEARLPLNSEDTDWRILPGKTERTFAVHSPVMVEFFSYEPGED